MKTKLLNKGHGHTNKIFTLNLSLSLLVLILVVFLTNEPLPLNEALVLVSTALISAVLLTIIMHSILIIIRIPKNNIKLVLLAYEIVLLSILIRTVFLPANFGILDGSELYRDFQHTELISDLIKITVSLGFGFYLTKYFNSSKINIFPKLNILIILGALIFSLTYQSSTNPEFEVKNLTNLNLLGRKKNVILILLDAAQGTVFNKVLQSNHDLADSFEGFTLYDHAVSQFPMTNFSLPAILEGGFEHLEGISFQEALERKNDNLFTDAQPYDYYTWRIPYATNNDWLGTPSYSYQILDPINTITNKITIFIARNSPPPVTQIIMRSIYVRFNKYFDVNFQYKLPAVKFLQLLSQKLDYGNHDKGLIFHHSYAAHPPTYYDEYGEQAYQVDSFVKSSSILAAIKVKDEDVIGESKYIAKLLGDLFSRVKEVGAWDNSLIVIFGDHGNTSANSDTELFQDDEYDSTFKGGNWRSVGMHNPAIFVKRPNQSKKFEISNKLISLTDIRKLVNLYISDNYEGIHEYLDNMQDNKSNYVYTSINNDDENYGNSSNYQKSKFEGNSSMLIQVFSNLTINSDDYLPIETNKQYTINSDNDHFILGNYIAEKGGMWVLHEPIKIFLENNEAIKSKTKLLLEATGLVSTSHPNQIISISVNNIDIGEISISSEKIYEIDIPEKAIVNSESIIIKITPMNPTSPSNIGAWVGNNYLSIYLKSFELRK